MPHYTSTLQRTISLIKRLFRNIRGVAAIEFALIALPFFGIIGATLEVGLLFLTEESLDQAFAQASRTIRVGGTTSGNPVAQQTEFVQRVCASTHLVNCDGLRARAMVVRTNTSIIPELPEPDANGNLPEATELQFDQGGPGDIIVLQLFYMHPLFFHRLGIGLGYKGLPRHYMAFATAFRNEFF